MCSYFELQRFHTVGDVAMPLTRATYNAVDRPGELKIKQIAFVKFGAKSGMRFRDALFVLDKFAR
jgi:hypothetical protein